MYRFLQDLFQPACIVGGVSRQRDWRQAEIFKQLGQGLPFPLGNVGDSPGKDEAAPVPRWCCPGSSALGACQACWYANGHRCPPDSAEEGPWNPGSTWSLPLPLHPRRRRIRSIRTGRFSSMACSRNSSTVNPLRDNRWLLTLALTRLESAYISGNSRPSRSSSSLRPWKMS